MTTRDLESEIDDELSQLDLLANVDTSDTRNLLRDDIVSTESTKDFNTFDMNRIIDQDDIDNDVHDKDDLTTNSVKHEDTGEVGTGDPGKRPDSERQGQDRQGPVTDKPDSDRQGADKQDRQGQGTGKKKDRTEQDRQSDRKQNGTGTDRAGGTGQKRVFKFVDTDYQEDNFNQEDSKVIIGVGSNPFPNYQETADVKYYSYITFKENPEPNSGLALIRKMKIDFPYKRHQFSKGPGEFFDRLKKSFITWSTSPYRIMENTFTHKLLPVTVKGVTIVNNNEIYMVDTKSLLEYDESVNPISDYFIENSRVKGRRLESKLSIYEGWLKDDDFVKQVIVTAGDTFKYVDAYSMREAMYIVKKYPETPAERPSFILGLYKYLLGDIDNPRIFDACAGYGDRLIAAIAMGVEYLGVEPNTMSKSGFDEMIKLFGDQKKQEIRVDSMPEARVPGKDYDLVFMSPPSFNSEIYSNDAGQSIAMYPNYEEWLKGFLFPCIDRCISLLKHDRFFCIQSILIEHINAYIRIRYPRMTYLGAVSVKTSGGRNKPIWIWLKKYVEVERKIPTESECLVLFDPKIRDYVKDLDKIHVE